MDGWGNPSSPHVVGRRAKEMLEESRATIADVLGVDADEIYFTSGSTESNNLAIRGACLAQRREPGQDHHLHVGAFVGDPNRSRYASRP